MTEKEVSNFKYFKLAADQGNPERQLSVGFCYLVGYGGSKNFELAFKYFKLSADQGNPKAQFQLANLYKNGEGTEKNLSEAIKYYSLSKNQGNECGIEFLNQMNEEYLDIQETLKQDQLNTKEKIQKLIDIK